MADCASDATCTGVEHFIRRERRNCQLQDFAIMTSSKPDSTQGSVACYRIGKAPPTTKRATAAPTITTKRDTTTQPPTTKRATPAAVVTTTSLTPEPAPGANTVAVKVGFGGCRGKGGSRFSSFK